MAFLFSVNVIINLCPLVVAAALSSSSLPKNQSVPAVIIFGDSIVDTGNNNYIPTFMRCDFYPYGRDFKGGKSTGRFSNGKIPSDIFAEWFGVKEFLPPYLDPNLQIQDLLTGVSFASAGSGYDPLTPKLLSVISLADQLRMFKEYTKKLKEAVSEERTAQILAQSIFILCLGSNDISVTYYLTPFRRIQYDSDEYTSILANISLSLQQELYQLGARRIGVMNVAPVGCVSLQRTLFGGLWRRCVKSENQLTQIFNSKLSSGMNDLRKRLPDAKLVYLDIYNAVDEIVKNPAKYGFQSAAETCCGFLNIELGLLCNMFQVKVCKNPSEYVFWDSYHPTKRAYTVIAEEVLSKTIDEFF
ncbi:hypothetical protein L6164_020191 [Bauhinia variegata]|uniref:Uncharacterized protein n=1 Tax=Bauhinia variegata TaxID=167791 RepID=A0ACB9MVW8_BAUVA|nr:hypothetical protein L6164_020191 [Bauhinia variegata]